MVSVIVISLQRQLWRDKRIDNRDRASRTSSLLSDPGSQVSCTSSVYNAEQSDLSEDTDVFESEKQYNNSINCQTLFQHSKSLTSVTANCGSKSHESDVMTTSVPLSVQVQGGVAKSHACKSPTSTRSMSPTLSHLSSCKYMFTQIFSQSTPRPGVRICAIVLIRLKILPCDETEIFNPDVKYTAIEISYKELILHYIIPRLAAFFALLFLWLFVARSLLSGCKHNMDSSSHGVGGVITSSRVSRRR